MKRYPLLTTLALFFLSIFVLPSATNAQSTCENRVTTESHWNTLNVESYAPPFNVFSSAKELMVGVACNTNSATLTVGSGNTNQYIWHTGYYWGNNTWNPITLTGSVVGEHWLVGTGTGSFPTSSLDLTDNNFVVGYVCTWQDGTWKCGCRDSSCATSHWNLQVFRQLTPQDPSLPDPIGSDDPSDDDNGSDNGSGDPVSETVEITHKASAGTNANSSSASSVSLSYNHPGGGLLVFFRHGDHLSSGYSVTFKGISIPVYDMRETGSPATNSAAGGMAYLRNVPASQGTLEVKWNESRLQRGVHVYSISGSPEIGTHATQIFGDTNSIPASVSSQAGDLVIAYIAWRNSAHNIISRGSGQIAQLSDDSPTRQQSDSKVGTSGTTSMSWNMDGAAGAQGSVVQLVSFPGTGESSGGSDDSSDSNGDGGDSGDSSSGAEEDIAFQQRKEWLLNTFQGRSLNDYMTALGRLAVADGNDPAAVEYLTQSFVQGSGADFRRYMPITRALYQYGDRFSSAQLQSIQDAATNKHVADLLDHNTENQASIRASHLYLLAQYFPNATWNTGNPNLQTSQQIKEEAKRRLSLRGQKFYELSNAEYLSTTYLNYAAFPLLTLAEFADDSEMRDIAEGLLLFYFGTLVQNRLDGHIMSPLNRRGRVQALNYPANINQTSALDWLLWGRTSIHPSNLTATDPTILFYAMSNWRVPEVLNRIALGAGAPYEIRGMMGPFGRWDRGPSWIVSPAKQFRHGWRDNDFAIGGMIAEYFEPDEYYVDMSVFDIAWRSNDQFRSLEVMHPYWRSNVGEDQWGGTHSPFQQIGVHRNTAIVLYNIPHADPWAGRGRWAGERNQHNNDLIKLGQARFPTTVDQIVQDGDWYFLREGNVYIAIRVLKSGHTLEQLKSSNPWDIDALWHVIKSRHAQTGFVFEVGTAEKHGSFTNFRNAVKANPLTVNWSNLEVDYRNTHGDNIRFRYDTNMSEVNEIDGRKLIWFTPTLTVNGQTRNISNWPVTHSPSVSLQNQILNIQQGGDSIRVDWRNTVPVITK